MSDRLQLGYQAAIMSLKSSTYGSDWPVSSTALRQDDNRQHRQKRLLLKQSAVWEEAFVAMYRFAGRAPLAIVSRRATVAPEDW